MNTDDAPTNEPTQEALRKEFAYDSDYGRLVRIRREGDAVTLLQRPADRPDGRVVHGAGGEIWLEHRLVWIWHNGLIGPNNVRHKISRTDNHIGNLYLTPVTGKMAAEQNRVRAQAAWRQWQIYPDQAESLATELAAGNWGSQEADRIACLVAEDIRRDAGNLEINEAFEALLAAL